MALSRRELIKRSAVAGAGLVVVGNVDIFSKVAAAAGASPTTLSGPLVPDPAGILDLPDGFSYRILTTAGDPFAGGGGLVPGRPDSMGCFATASGLRIVQNHEQGTSGAPAVVADAAHTYDPGAMGGTTTLALDGANNVVGETVSIAGTFNNCSGGVSPWGTWLTCEETENKAGASGGVLTRDHGYVFEVDPLDDSNNVTPTPLVGLGRFAHEAAIVDPATGVVYLTEDASQPNGLLYRFVPDAKPSRYGDLRGTGKLYAMYVPGVDDLSVFTQPRTTLDVTWKEVPDPTALTSLGSIRKQFTYKNYSTGETVTGPGGAITRSKKFEGAWWSEDRGYIVCSFAHGATDWSAGSHDGQVWSYDPVGSKLRLELSFVRATDPNTQPDGPDNITVSPYGGFLLCEDGDGVQHLLTVGDDGRTTVFARNAASDSEFTGAVFSPDASTLFVNIQDQGYTFAITGPFGRFNRTR